MKIKIFSLIITIIILFSVSALALDFSVESFRGFNKTSSDFVFEAKVIGTGTYNYTLNFNDGDTDIGSLNSTYSYFSHSFNISGPKNISFALGDDDNNLNNNASVNICIKGTEIPNNGIDEDCNGVDLIFTPINITIITPLEQNSSVDYVAMRTNHTWDIDVSTNIPAESCSYEFGMRENYYNLPPKYFNVVSSGVLTKISNTSFKSLNVATPEHNYLRVYCNDSFGIVYNKTIQAEIDLTFPGTVTDLRATWSDVMRTDLIRLHFTMPGDDNFDSNGGISYLTIFYSNEPITVSNYDSLPTLIMNLSSNSCYFQSNYIGGTDFACNVRVQVASLVNNSWVKPTTYFAVETMDNVYRQSAISNFANITSKVYDCGITNLTVTKDYSPYNNNSFTQGQTFYDGERGTVNITIKNNGDGMGCRFETDPPLAGFMSKEYSLSYVNEFVPLVYGETKTYSWNVSFDNISTYEGYANMIRAYAEEWLSTGGWDFNNQDSSKDLAVMGINFTKYFRVYISSGQNMYLTQLPKAVVVWIENWAQPLSSEIRSNNLDALSFRWVPFNLSYRVEYGFEGPVTLSHITGSYKNYNLSSEFLNYTCDNIWGTCYMPYVRQGELNNDNMGWVISNLSYGGYFFKTCTAGVPGDEVCYPEIHVGVV